MALVLSMVPLAENRLPTVEQLCQVFALDVPADEGPHNVEFNGKALTMQIGEHDVAVGLVPRPIPWSDLEGPAATSFLWRDAAAELQNQQAHMLVTVFGKQPEPISLWMTMTRVAAALVATPWALGVYWPVAGLVHAPATFRALTAQMNRQALPVPLWIGVRIGSNDDGSLYGFTTGMAAFEYMELEISSCDWTPQEIIDRLYSFAHYVLASGVVLEQGQTIGVTADEKISIEYRPSICGDGRTVVHLQP